MRVRCNHCVYGHKGAEKLQTEPILDEMARRGVLVILNVLLSLTAESEHRAPPSGHVTPHDELFFRLRFGIQLSALRQNRPGRFHLSSFIVFEFFF